MDLGDGSFGSRSEEQQKGQTLEIGTHFDENELGFNRPCVNDFGDLGSVETVEKVSNFNENDLGVNGPCVEEIGDLGSVEPVEKSSNFDENELEINGPCGVEIGDLVHGKHIIETFTETKGEGIERIEIKKEVEMPLEGVGSPSRVSEGVLTGFEDVGSRCRTEEEKRDTQGEACFDEIRSEVNGSFVDEIGDLGSGELGRNTTSIQSNGKDIEIENAVEMAAKAIGSPSGDSRGSSTLKGYGLRKWRRIRRDHSKDGGNEADLSRILKRGLSNAEPVKTRDFSSEHNQKSEGSVASMNSSVAFSSLPVEVSDFDSSFALEAIFSTGIDPDINEDQNSKSSTAASIPKSRQEVPVTIGFAKEKNKAKKFSSKGSGNVVHRAQHGKGKVETSKKLRGERVKIEKENSYSSVESDLRSSNAIFTQVGGFPVVSNGRQSERFSNYDGENSDEAHVSEPQSSEEVRQDCYKDNGEEVDDFSGVDLAANVSETKKGENHGSNTDRDPLFESINFLQAAQEALEKEIQNFGEIGKEALSLHDRFSHDLHLLGEFSVTRAHEPKSSNPLHFNKTEVSSFSLKNVQLTELFSKVNLLERLLEEASASLKAKESKVLDLESILNGTQLPKKETEKILLQDTCKVMEVELEDLFMKKIEAEIEYLITRKLKVEAKDQITLFEEQKSLAEDQAQMLLKLRDAENKATLLKRQAEELETYSKELLRTEEILKMQNSICKSTLFSLIQLIILCIVFGLFLLQLLPHSTGVVPT
ncbi:WPP domain-interacting protein 2-like [Tasmannia lanceolata]|uniref:WPP domain-interacting protein 2-like n=1 Tax=Tasmannia lanceolata TaxID=3420 RepID=UPI004063857E